jgi:hypothetical protein
MTNDDGLTYEHYIMSDRDMRTWQVVRDNVYLRNNSFIAQLQPPPILTAPTSGEISLVTNRTAFLSALLRSPYPSWLALL